jgi:hypothetical protein
VDAQAFKELIGPLAQFPFDCNGQASDHRSFGVVPFLDRVYALVGSTAHPDLIANQKSWIQTDTSSPGAHAYQHDFAPCTGICQRTR